MKRFLEKLVFAVNPAHMYILRARSTSSEVNDYDDRQIIPERRPCEDKL